MDLVLLVVGFGGVIAGTCMREPGSGLGWNPVWGPAKNSTPAGKAIFVLGVIGVTAGGLLLLG